VEGLVIVGIVAVLIVLFARSIRERVQAGYRPKGTWSRRSDNDAGLGDPTFREIVDGSPPRRF
jgi:hypothetical protein